MTLSSPRSPKQLFRFLAFYGLNEDNKTKENIFPTHFWVAAR